MYFLYILLCSDNTLYTGITNNIDLRIKNHNSGYGSKYVASRLPVKLVFSESFSNKSNAAKRERQLKGWKHDKKLKILGIKL